MVLVAVDLHATCKLLYFSIYADVQIAFAAHLLKEFSVMTFAVADERRKNVYLSVLIIGHDHIHHFFLGVFHHLFTTHIRVRLACTGIE